MAASEIAIDDTPRRICLKRSVRQLSKEIVIKDKKLKSLQQTIRRKNKKIANMQTIINDIKNQNFVDEETSVSLLESFGKHKDLVTNWTKKNLGKKIPKRYSPAVRQFALSLHFFSGKAYEYVRDQFNTILPHPRTLSKWYSHFNAEPGFTMESLKLLELKVRNSSDPVFCALIMDEMAIRQHLEYDRTTGKYYGRVDMGSGIDNDSIAVAKECLVFLVVSINENWKLPIGYFLANSLNSAQKVELVRHALHVLSNTGVNIISLTFDGCSSNITAAKLLGCNFTVDALNTSFASEYDDSKIVAIFDPAHMIKLVQAFGEKKIFLDYENNEINFEYVQRLCYLQEQEGCHLANKLRKNHILFFKQKMKVKLATQLLSQSVADALKFCKDTLKIHEFSNAGATISFIEMFNKVFDILNSRSINCIESKKALCKENIEEIKLFTNHFCTYIKGLKILESDNNFIPVLESKRKTGFIGFIVSLNSLLQLYSTLIESNKLSYIKAYKVSQDHLEIFFCSIRSHGGFNNNPTVRQFRSAYRKLVIRTTDMKQFNTGNCIPLEDIDILHYSSSDPVTVLNNNSTNINSDKIVEEENSQNINSFIMDHDYIVSNSDYSFSYFSKEVITYVAGFVVHKLTNTLKCNSCKYALCATDKACFLNSFITLKNKVGDRGGLIYPSDSVMNICFKTEKVLKKYSYRIKAVNKLQIQSEVLTHFLYNSNLFASLKTHSHETRSPLTDHITLLIKSITSTYVNLKIDYTLKNHNETPSLRMWYNKLTIFKGQ